MTSAEHNPFPRLEGSHGMLPGATGRDTWVEDTYGDRAWVGEHTTAPERANEFIGLAATSRRIFIFFSALAIVVAVLFGRVSYLVAHGNSFRAAAENNRLRTISVSAARGVIYDRSGVQLTENVSDLKLALVSSDLPTDKSARAEALSGIAAVIGVPTASFEEQLAAFPDRSYESIVVAEQITRDQAVALTIARGTYSAIRIVGGSHRRYTLDNTLPSLSHLLGYLGRVSRSELDARESTYVPTDSTGKTGLEFFYEQELRGQSGVRKVEVDALGNEMRTIGETGQEPGKNITLSIDTELTAAAEASLARVMGLRQLTRAAVVIEEVHTGELLTLISLPAYSNNRFAQGMSVDEYRALADDPTHPLFPRAISGVYPSGSTIKLVVAAAALAEQVVTPSTTVNSSGGILYADRWWFPDWKAGGHGSTNVRKALAWSVNTFFYMVGGGYEHFAGLGIDRLIRYYDAFGIGSDLGIDLPHASDGLLPTPAWKEETKHEQWFIGDTYHMAIGQGDLLVTPLHVAAWTTVVANGGMLWRPHLAHAFSSSDGGDEQIVPSRSLREQPIAPADALAVVREGMRDAVTYGSAVALNSLPIAVAGKTGTAQGTVGRSNHAWFTGFAPYEDPQIAVTVLVEEGGEGSSVAVPVARDIFAWWAAHRYAQSTGETP